MASYFSSSIFPNRQNTNVVEGSVIADLIEKSTAP